MIQNLKNNGTQFPEVDLSTQEINLNAAIPMSMITHGKAFYLNDTTIAVMASENSQALTLKVPDPKIFGQDVFIELTRVNILAEGFEAKTASGLTVDVSHASHYRGSVRGIPGSLAAINVFGKEISGFYSLPDEGNFVVGKMKDTTTNQHVVIPESELPKAPYKCETKDDGISVPLQDENVQSATANAVVDPCVRVYVESDYDLYQNKGNSQAVINYLLDVFSKSATIYANDGIKIQLSDLLVWDTPSPYKGINRSIDLLNKFGDVRKSIKADIGHLVALRGGGGVAWVDGLCRSDTRYKLGFSGIYATSDIVNDYSWTVAVFTHEMGHLLGSKHTHACVWNDNNTAIDGCYVPEGACARPGVPVEGGTIMSYCHLTSTGTKFTNGFGLQPAALIRNKISQAVCLTECSTPLPCTFSLDHNTKDIIQQGGTDTITITTNDGCIWGTTSNDSWIRFLTRSSGVGNGSVSILVGANPSPNSRTGTVTIAGLTYTVTQAPYTPGSELITNGNFNFQSIFWNFSEEVETLFGDYTHNGNAYVLFGYLNSQFYNINQTISIPITAVNPSLTFFLNISSQEFSTTQYDTLQVNVNSSGVITRLDNASNLNKGIPGVYVQKGPYNLSAYAGKTITLEFVGATDKNRYTAFRIADVSVR